MRSAVLIVGLVALALVAPASTQAQQWTGIIAPSRAIDWSNAGVIGGIPARTKICSTLNPGVTAAQINAAISACPNGQTVFLNAGTYNIGGIDFNGTSNVTVRGAGADQTFIVSTGTASCQGFTSGICLDSVDNSSRWGISNLVNWTAGYVQGTRSITLASVPNLKVGNIIIVDQLDDDATGGCDMGGIIISMATTTCTPTAPGIGGPFSLEGNFGGAQRVNGGSRQQEQIVTVTGCGGITTRGFSCSGTNVQVTISPGLYMPNWRASQSPQAWWATFPILNSGVENLSLDATGLANAAGIEIDDCLNCWVKGVRIVNTARAHVQVIQSAHVTIRDTYEFLTQNSATQSYGVECFSGSDLLVENNIFQAITSPEMVNGACSGNVWSYNFNINNFYTASSGYSMPGASLHTAGIDFLLYEGNVTGQVDDDVFHGTHHFVTHFRNYQSGTQPTCWISGLPYASATFGACNNNFVPARILAFSRFYNYIGNVLGTIGLQIGYSSGPLPIYSIGNGNANGMVTVPHDNNVGVTLMRWGNYDTFNAAVRFSSTEIPSALTGVQAPFSNPVPASQALPASFYLNAKPSWWPTAKPWPPVGPDVAGGNVANVGGHVYTIPAQDCYLNTMGGAANGTGSVLNFNANTCYASSSATLPAAPTGLQAVVH